MDRVIEKKKWTTRKIITIAFVVSIVMLIAGSIYFTSGATKLNVDSERLTISEVKKGSFKEFIPVNGIVLPLTTIYLDAVEGGRVEEKFVEDGTMMKRGEPILKLLNTDLELSLANQETSVFNLLTQMRISRNAAQQNTIMKLNQRSDIENTFKESERIYKVNKQLFEQKVISEQDYKQSENNYTYAVQKRKLTEQILKQDSVSTKEEYAQAEESYKRTQQSLAIMRKKVEDLIVRAPIDGQLTSLDAEIGQNKNKGERLGQIDVLSGFKVRVDIDEHYISRIYTGLIGEFTFSGKDYKLKIHKVYTQVTNGKFQVDMKFEGEIAKEIRRGQTLQIRLALSDETEALLLAKGGFYQQTGGNWVFKLNEDGSKAYKVDIQLGRQNPEYYEVMQGLKPGDKIITSGYDNYENTQELVLKESK
ncbi:efflux RND transporter periplasmic adaptor subunit [Aurantibacillus circumpalustris]|uniref:efflux RND transporter periplasmic adaptor subunit n=1 Tax=Aurantibacillus circumpalustris TaxID=3036359 RepID=UPI00295BD97A|nr:efflux RND transporter periplasmic adaptor subunit [Aurantibacillus circumpalustris]